MVHLALFATVKISRQEIILLTEKFFLKKYILITLILTGFTLLTGSTGSGDKSKILNSLKNISELRDLKIQFKVSFNDRQLVGNLNGKLAYDILLRS